MKNEEYIALQKKVNAIKKAIHKLTHSKKIEEVKKPNDFNRYLIRFSMELDALGSLLEIGRVNSIFGASNPDDSKDDLSLRKKNDMPSESKQSE